jgi:hypothetical protein
MIAFGTRTSPASLLSLGCPVERSVLRAPDARTDPPRVDLSDRYHTPPTDTLEPTTYEGWKQFRLLCDRCHSEDALGTSFGPNLLVSLKPDGSVPNRAAFVTLLLTRRPDRGIPAASRLGLEPKAFDGLYDYLEGRSSGKYLGGRPARKPQ